MTAEAPEPGAVRAKCGECSAWHPMHAETCSKFVPERHSGAQTMLWLDAVVRIAVALVQADVSSKDVAFYSARIADALVLEAKDRGRL